MIKIVPITDSSPCIGPVDPSKHFTTTTSSLVDRKRGIDLEVMPKTFQDAVKVTRKLGFRYLWIDSLCIIQDDAEDWERQSALMGQIYHRATITIMAAATPTSSLGPGQGQEGFLRRRRPSALPTVKMQYQSENGKPAGEWFIRASEHLLPNSRDLFTRGWVMQEQLLSRRKIIYTPNQLLWVCSSPSQSQIFLIALRNARPDPSSKSTAKWFWDLTLSWNPKAGKTSILATIGLGPLRRSPISILPTNPTNSLHYQG